MSAAPLAVANSYAALSVDNPLRRAPRAPERQRPAEFAAAFDTRTLFYDCFRHVDGQRILLVGPPAMNLAAALRGAAYVAKPSGTRLAAKLFPSISTMVTELTGAPDDTTHIEVTVGGETLALAVQPNDCQTLAGRRLLFTISRDNDLAWIREWAELHQRLHGTDAVILFDNGSTRYDTAELQATLANVPGIAFAGVHSWPYSFGPYDAAVTNNPYWARFLQIGSMGAVLRRYGELAYGLCDSDIDELAGTRSGTSIYDLARRSFGGLVVFRGTWIEAVGEGTRQRDFTERLRDPKLALSPQRKWALDPSRPWVRKLSVHPYWHWIEGRGLFAKSMSKDATYWHFKAINTNWKHQRTTPPAGATETDPLLAATVARLGD
jgi:hypothetical protein